MKKSNLKFLIVFMFVLILCIIPYAKADWNEGDSYKMHYPQLPKAIEGWDVALFSEGSIWLADDWECTETGPVSDIHFWVSWRYDDVQPIDGFSIRIWSDDPCGPNGWSQPNELLWERDFTAADIIVRPMSPEPQGWFDPYWQIVEPFDHIEWAQVNITDITDPFIQHEGEVYWLMIDVWAGGMIGWKQSGSPQFRDDAVYFDGLEWVELRDPFTYESLDLAFVITTEEPFEPKPLIEHSKWSQPPIEIDPHSTPPVYCGWDEPSFREYIEPTWFDAWDCRTQCYGDADCDGYVGISDEGILEAAFGSCYPEPKYDPRADFDHDLCITGNDVDIHTQYRGEDPPPDCDQRPQSWLVVADDFRCLGSMPIISLHWWGSYWGWDQPSGMPPLLPIGWKICFWSNVPADLFGEPDFSYPEELLWQIEIDADRVDIQKVARDFYNDMYPEDICYQYNLQLEPNEWFWQSEFEDDTIDNIFWISIAAIYNPDEYPEFPWGWKTRPESWMDDAIWFYLDVPPDPNLILDPFLNSMWPLEEPMFGQSVDVAFELDTDPNYIKWEQSYTGIRDWPHYEDRLSMAHIERWVEHITKWSQKPDLEDINSIDVDATTEQIWKPQVLADDFLCEVSGPITNILVWGSWYHSHPPFDDVNEVTFTLSIYADVNASESPTGYSMPGELLWQHQFHPGSFEVTVYNDDWGDWFVPCSEPPYFEILADNTCYLYDFYIWPTVTFEQQEGNIYWLSVQAKPHFQADWPEPIRFGWRNTEQQWNDSAVWAIGEEPYISQWNQLLGPLGHPYEDEPIDLAFAIVTDSTHKWEQLPVPLMFIIDTDATTEEIWRPQVLADDFLCTDTGPLTDIHIWGSWFQDHLPYDDANNVTFTLSIHDDIPADPNSPFHSYSKPGELLWMKQFQPGDFDVSIYAQDLNEGWFVPCCDTAILDERCYWPDADTICWKYDFYIDRDEAFQQQGTEENPVIYWLDVQAEPNTSIIGVPPETIHARFGWKTSYEHWNDSGVYGVGQDPPPYWSELRYPQYHQLFDDKMDLAFEITGEVVHEEVNIGKLVADDWLCERRTPVTAITWFGSYLAYMYETPCETDLIRDPPVPPDYFLISIYKDVPADDPDNEYVFSHPGGKLWEYAAYDYDEVLVGYDKYPHANPLADSATENVPVTGSSSGEGNDYTATSQAAATSYEALGALSNVAIFQDYDPWGSTRNQDILTANGISWTIYDSTDMGIVDLSGYDKVIIASQQAESFYAAVDTNRAWFEAYVSSGGILDMHLACLYVVPIENYTMPGGFVSTDQEAGSSSEDVTIVDTTHPVVTTPHTITDADLDGWSSSTHGWFDTYPAGAVEIIEEAGTGNPCAMDVQFGSGRIFATVQPVEWSFASYNYCENTILYDVVPVSGREPVYRYSVRLPEDEWFRQREVNDVYWISIVAVYEPDVTLNHQGWGWTIHEHVFGDNAVEGYWLPDFPDQWVWEEIYDQTGLSADMSFILFTDPNECVDCADYNWDDIVNFFDYAIFSLDWMWIGPAGGYANGDLNCNGKVDFKDVEIFCLQWLDSCP